ncbi:hypothetical protein [Candidatus Poriferisodalis sp.]|uniref:hypothetical protein n=1 Tax=Candidatus Poriferisodalis sp. TaxID=3101277 RepID=UPI003B52D4ED
MTSWSRPSEPELAEVEALAIRPENRRYFFDRLENPNWVSPLAQRGYFGEPPEPIRDDESGHVRYPPWPEGRYLARMASEAPDEVAEVLSRIPRSSNPAVTRILLEALDTLPDEQFGQLAGRVIEWVAAPGVGFFDDKAASVVARLFRGNLVKEGLRATRVLLALQSRTTPAQEAAEHGSVPYRAEPVGRCSDWEYERTVTEILPDLVGAAGSEGLALVSSLLDDSIRLSRGPSEPLDDDPYSYIWRPAIEDHPQNTDHGVRSTVVSAVRDAAVMLAGAGEEELEATVRRLDAGSTLHRRIALHVLANTSGGAHMVSERIADTGLFEDPGMLHEYAGLLRQRFSDADPEACRSYLAWVLAGPDVEQLRQRWADLAGSPPSEEDVAGYVGHWQRDRLSFVADRLPDDVVDIYQGLAERFGEPEHPDFSSWSSVSTGPESPMPVDDMRTWPLSQVVEYLQRWRPDDSSARGFGPSIRGLGQTFRAAVVDRAADFSTEADLLGDLDPTYVRSFLDGIEDAVKAGVSVSWAPLLRLMAAVVEHPFEPDEDVRSWDRDPGWRWARGATASLIKTGVTDRDNRISFQWRDAVWQILEPLTSDPDPSPATEATRIDGSPRFHNLSINSNRGTAMHAVVEFALWCRREFEASGADIESGFDLLPEVRTVLQAHLQPEQDPSLAIRTVYGQWLPWLALLDERWVIENTSQIFPRAPELSGFRDAAWDTYICWCSPYDSVFRAIRGEYEAAVERVSARPEADSPNDERPDQQLGQHLVILWWRSTAPHSLLDRWFELADDELAAGVMNYVGTALRNTEGDIDPEIHARIRELWDSRIEEISYLPDAHPLECQAFASTFASGKLEDDWSLAHLETTLRWSRPGWHSWHAVERLAEVAAARPAAATRLALKMLNDTADDWDHTHWSEPIQSLLQATIDDNDHETQENRSAIIDHYVMRGDHEFRQFIAPRSA